MWKILVVDDNFINRKLILEILKGKADCDVAANGFEAIGAYNLSIRENSPYDLILLDIAMPEIDGMEILRKIRQNEESAGIALGEGIPIIMVTAFKEYSLEAFNKGCDDYLVKPISSEKLIAKIEEKLKKKNAG